MTSALGRTRLLFVCVIAFLPACRNRMGNGGGTLTAQEKAAVDSVVKQLDGMASAVGGAVDGLTNVDRNANGQFGACPVATYTIENGVGTVALNYPEGCENPYYEGATISGSVAVAFDLNTGLVTVTFTDFDVDGETTNGTMSLQRGTGQDVRTWNGSIDIQTTGVGSAVGDITVEVDAVRQSITVDPASLTLTDSQGTSYSVEIEGIVIKPVANHSFIPESGTVTFVVPNTAPTGPATLTIVVTFDANSPSDRTVSVSVSNSGSIDYTLPGF